MKKKKDTPEPTEKPENTSSTQEITQESPADTEPTGDLPIVPIENADTEAQPEGIASTAFREVSEHRELLVQLSTEERETFVHRLVEIPREIDSLKEDKKASANSFKTRIETLEKEQRETGILVEDGGRLLPVRCEWRFKTAGVDSVTGEPIHHPEKKTLVRCDTGAVVEVVDMKSADYDHLELNLGDLNEKIGDAPSEQTEEVEKEGAEDLGDSPPEGSEGEDS